MDWLVAIAHLFSRIPIERAIFPPRDSTKALEQFTARLKPSESQKEAPVEVKPKVTIQTSVVTREGVDAERLAWQNGLIRGELWLLEGHLKNNCLGCGGDVECCFKHCQNVIDASRETQSMTTEPLYGEAITVAQRVQPFVHPEDIKAGKYASMYPALSIEVSGVRTQFDKKVMEHARQPITLEEAQKIAAEEATKEVERKWQSREKKPGT